MRLALRVCAGLALVGSGLAGAQERQGPAGGREGAPRQSYANPSAVIAAELAFAQDAQVRGQWTAFAAAAAPDAVMVTPRMVWAQQWLKGRANPPAAVLWQPYQVWSSCDGSLMASHGVWRDGTGKQSGWFTTLWRREFDGGYKWVFDHGADGPVAAPASEMIAAQVADCPARARRADGDGKPGERPPKRPKAIKIVNLPPLDPLHREGAAGDASLRWDVVVAPDGGRVLTVRWTKDGAEVPVLVEKVAAPAAAG